MSIKPTVFGVVAGTPAAPAAPVPQDATGGFKPTSMPASDAAAPAPTPSTFRPTAVGGGTPVQPTPAAPSRFVPTGIPAAPPAPEQQPSKMRDFGISTIPGMKRAATELTNRVVTGMESAGEAIRDGAQQVVKAITPSALPGLRRTGLDVPMEELRTRYPSSSELELDRTRGVLSGVMLATATSATWLEFGLSAQEELAAMVRERLETVQQPAVRVVAQHLARMQALLSDVLEAFEGGLFRRSPDVVWNAVKAEVQSLEQLLKAGGADLGKQLKAFEAQKAKVPALELRLGATALAVDYLADKQADAAGLLVARLASLTGSQTLLKEHALHLVNDIENVQELSSLVQAGVLVKLPAVYTQLAALTGKPNDTQRFLAAEKLNDVLHVIKQRKTV